MNGTLLSGLRIAIGLMMLGPSLSLAAQKNHRHYNVPPRSSGYGLAPSSAQGLAPEAAAMKEAQKMWPGTYLCDEGGYRIRPCYMGSGDRGAR